MAGEVQRYIAFDLGAESGRAILGTVADGKIQLDEIHRWLSRSTEINGTRHWDILYIFGEMLEALRICARDHVAEIDGMGVDTWGVDYGMISPSGVLAQNPVHYRDHRIDGVLEEAYEVVPREEIYARTGLQFMQINTLFQLFKDKDRVPEIFAEGHTMIMVADLLHYFLSGVAKAEYTLASTSQMIDVHKRSWDEDLIAKFGIPTHVLPEIVPPGTVLGPLLDSVAADTKIAGAQVIAPCTHDTASAVLAAPGEGDDWAYISCGTWSLLGLELDEPVADAAACEANITNEGGIGNTIRFLKNIMGLWVFQQARQAWLRDGQEYSYPELTKLAADAAPFQTIIDVDDTVLLNPPNMLEAIEDHCKRNDQPYPDTVGGVARSIIEGLAARYAITLKKLESCSGRTINRVHMIGGGIQNELLCQLAADAMNVEVVAGPVEATALGNIATQHIALGHVAGPAEARKMIMDSAETKVFAPQNHEAWKPVLAKLST